VQLVQLRAGGAEDEQRNAGRPVDEVLEELEQCRVGPVQVPTGAPNAAITASPTNFSTVPP
jgi:hypothetical protein